MKSLHRISFSGLAFLLIAATLPVGCTLPENILPSAQPSADGASTSDSTQQAGATGIVYTGRGVDGRLVPPNSPIKVQIMDQDTEVVSTLTDNMGRFFLNDIPATSEGSKYQVKVGSVFAEEFTFFPGRILNLSAIQSDNQKGSQEATQISGTLLDSSSQPLGNVTVRDKEFPFRNTTTNAAGEFTLEVVSNEVEVVVSDSQPPVSIETTEFDKSSLIKVETGNVRTITGVVKDSTNSNVALKNVKLRVKSRSTSTTTDADGKFTLNGAPIGPFILEVEAPEGYAPLTLQIPPATFDAEQHPETLEQNIGMQPVGSILVNFHVEDAPDFDRLPGSVNSCSPLNCKLYDLNPQDGTAEAYYHNTLGVVGERVANVTVAGTDISQEVKYPEAEILTLRGTSLSGDVLTIPQAVTAHNYVVSVLLKDLPGGKQNVTISMTGMQTQKSIPVYVPPKDTISTDLITLYYVQQVNSFGDVQGIIHGIDSTQSGEVRIGFLDLAEDLSFEPTLDDHTNPELLDRIRSAVTSPRSVTVDKATGEYYLKNVTSGTRIMLVAALVSDSGEISDCYIPNTSVLLNVRASEINYAPDLTLVKRPSISGSACQ